MRSGVINAQSTVQGERRKDKFQSLPEMQRITPLYHWNEMRRIIPSVWSTSTLVDYNIALVREKTTSSQIMHDRKKEYKIQLYNILQCRDHFTLGR